MANTHFRKITIFFVFAVFLVVVVESGIGVNWGTVSQQRLPPDIVVSLLKDNNITKVKLFGAEPDVLKALMGSGIEVMVGIPNELLSNISSSPALSDLWVSQNVSKYMVQGGVNIKYVAVGNEPFLKSYDNQYQDLVVPALKNLQQSLSKANLGSAIKLTVPVNADAYEGKVPSEGTFRPELTKIITEMVTFLNASGSPFIVNIYPFLSLYQNTDFPQDYAFFDGTAHPVIDGTIVYNNSFDGNHDTLVAALTKLGFGQMPIVIGEVGWPTDGAIGANVSNAKAFNQGLTKRLLSNQGTPLRPGTPPMDVYLFGLLDENGKSVLPGNFERHWGIFSIDGQAKYDLNLGNGSLKNAKGVQYLPSQWCVAKASQDASTMANQFKNACNSADCTALSYGGSCNGIGEKGNLSYAFNSYYQFQQQNPQSCDFCGLGEVTSSNPSVGSCQFPVGLVMKVDTPPGCKSSGSYLKGGSVMWTSTILWGICWFLV